MGKPQPNESEDVELNSTKIIGTTVGSTLLLPVFLLINVILIVSILIVSGLWAGARNSMKMTMIPAPNQDRSLCIPGDNDEKGKCSKILPEKYITEQIHKNLEKNHMKYMTEKLNYANVVCRKNTPSVYMFKGLTAALQTVSKNLIWNSQSQEIHAQKSSVKYDKEKGLVEILKGGAFFVYSQVTEKVANFRNQTMFTIRKISNGKEENLMESIGGSCNLIYATSKRSHYVGSAFHLSQGDVLFASHSHPGYILATDSFFGLRQLG